MIVSAEIRCESQTRSFEDPCPPLKLYPTTKHDGRVATEDDLVALDDVPDAMAERMRLKGWVTIDGKHYCPRHTRDKIGNRVQLGAEYTLIGDGWEARVPDGSLEPAILEIEVRRVPDAASGADTLAR